MSHHHVNCKYNPTIVGISRADCDSAFEWLFKVFKAIEDKGSSHANYKNAVVADRLISGQATAGNHLHDICHQKDAELAAKDVEILRLQGELRDLTKTVAGQAMIIEVAGLGKDEEADDADLR